MDTDRQLLMGGSQVACTYYFAVILATRKFLTLYILDQLKQGAVTGVATNSQLDDKTTSLAFVCLNAAIRYASPNQPSSVCQGDTYELEFLVSIKALMHEHGRNT